MVVLGVPSFQIVTISSVFRNLIPLSTSFHDSGMETPRKNLPLLRLDLVEAMSKQLPVGDYVGEYF